ncbi:MAG: ATP synthase F0 subunit B [Acidobacteria bacterium]|nr:ATP synthase F0 subunit B [Acidobacteriota bacterium]
MRRRWLILWLCAFFSLATGVTAFAQERSQQPSVSEQDSSAPWKITNFLIFALGLGWFLAKKGPRFFAARSADIQKAIKDATGLKMDADLRYSEIDRKIASLAETVKQLRDQGAIDMEQVHQQILRQTEQQIQHIRESTAAEAQALHARGHREVKRYITGLTLSLAEQRLQKHLSEGEPDSLFQNFVNLLERGKN